MKTQERKDNKIYLVKRQHNFCFEKTTIFCLKKAIRFCLKKATIFCFKKAAEFCFEEETFCAGSFALVLKTIETIETILNLICRCNDNLDQGC